MELRRAGRALVDNARVRDRERRERSVPLACAAVAVLLAAIPVRIAVAAAGNNASGLIRMAADEPIAELARESDPQFRFVDIGAHYDGVYFYAIARDPFARSEAHTLIDKSAYRYGHAGYGWLAALFSLGQPKLIPIVLVLLALAGMGIAGWAVSRIFEDAGWSGWWGLTIGMNPGLIYAATATTSEPVGAAILSVGLLLWLRDRTKLAAIFIAALCFFKEPFVMVPVGLAAFELISLRRKRPRKDWRERIALLAVGPSLFAAWYLYLYQTFGRWPFSDQEDFFQFPFAGWIDSIRQSSLLAQGPFFESQLGAPTVALITVVGALLAVGLVRAARLTSGVHAIFIPLALIVICLSPLGVLFPKDLIRECAIPLLLVPLCIGLPSSAADPLGGASLDHHHVAQPAEG